MPNALAQTLVRVDPPFWFRDMKNPHLELLLQWNAPLTDIQKISSDDPIVNTSLSFRVLENRAYIAIAFDLPKGFDKEELPFNLYTGRGKKLIFRYSFRKKQVTSPVNGVNSGDFIYMLMPDRFSNGDPGNDNNPKLREAISNRNKPKGRHGGDIQGMINHLDYLQELGITALWPTPLLENNEPLDSYHGYAITDHYAIDPRFGDLQTYLTLKKEAEKRGIKLIQDMIYNHLGDQHYLFQNPPSKNWFNAWDTFTRTNYKATTLIDPYAAESDKKQFASGWFDHHMPDLNQQNPMVARYLIQNTLWWIELAGLNGLRIDTYTYPDQEFMRELMKAVLEEYPDLGVFGETWVQGNALQAYFVQKNPCLSTDPLLPGVTDFQVYFALSHALTNEFGWTEGLARIYHTLAEDYLYHDPGKNVLFIDNHDLSRFYSVVGEDLNKMKMALGFMLTTRGIPSLYYGTEILMKNFSRPDALVREDFPGGWSSDTLNKFLEQNRTTRENELFGFIQSLARYRKNSAVLQYGKLKQFIPYDGVYVYFRYNEKKERVMVIMNQNTREMKIHPDRFSEIISGQESGRDILSNKTFTFESEITIAPQSIMILEIQ